MSVGLPTNVNKYMPMANSSLIRKISLINYSANGQETNLNSEAFCLLNCSDLGMSYDIKTSGSGIIKREMKEKDIVMKILINHTYSNGARETTYDGLTDFLKRLKGWDTTPDRRGLLPRTVPDLALKWTVPTEGGFTVNRYRDVVVTDIQWTEISQQYQGIVVDLTLKPIGPWYYRYTYLFTNQSMYSSGTRLSGMQFLYSGYPIDINLFGDIRYDICIDNTLLTSDMPATIELEGPVLNQRMAARVMVSNKYKAEYQRKVHFGNLRGQPYIVSNGGYTWDGLLPNSPTHLTLIPEGSVSDFYITIYSWLSFTANVNVEFNVPISI